jgi:hypothetical protein
MIFNNKSGLRLCVIGDKGAGKSHFLATLYMHLMRIAHTDNTLGTVSTDEEFNGGVGIRENFDRLRNGNPTKPMSAGDSSHVDMKIPIYPQGIRKFLRWLGILRPKEIELHLLDSSGEYQQFLMADAKITVDEQYYSSRDEDYVSIQFDDQTQREFERTTAGLSDEKKVDIDNQFKNILGQYDAYVLLYSLYDDENDVKQGDPVDIKLARFLDNVKRYRVGTNRPPPDDVMLVFTKSDLASSKFAATGIPKINEMEGRQCGMFFSPLTYTAIEVMTGHGEPPSVVSFTDMEKNGKFKTEIDTESGGRVTKYPQPAYSDVVMWIKEIG